MQRPWTQRLWNLMFWQSENEVITAIKARDYVRLRELLKAGIDVNVANAKGESPLTVAMQLRDLKALRILLCVSNAIIKNEHILLAADFLIHLKPSERNNTVLITQQITAPRNPISYAQFKKAIREGEPHLVTAYIYQNKTNPEEMEKIRDFLAIASLKGIGTMIATNGVHTGTRLDYEYVFDIIDETLGEQDPAEIELRVIRLRAGKYDDIFADISEENINTNGLRSPST